MPIASSCSASRAVPTVHYTPARVPPSRLNPLNQAVPAAVQRRGRTFLTGTRLGDVEALRACILSPATTEADLAVLLDEIRAAAPRGSA